MDYEDFSRSRALNTIPRKKLLECLSNIDNEDLDFESKNVKKTAIHRYADANIPFGYWFLKMDKHFTGDPNLLKRFNEYVEDIKSSYSNGVSICFAGSHGVGKTMVTSNILKKASNKGYSCLYTTLSDIVNVLIQSEEKYIARRELSMVDFLAIDEFDSRFIPTENAADLYARTLENIFRTRSQNKLPTLMATNSPNIVETFSGPLKQSINSLFNGYLTIFPVFGTDYRNKK